MPNEWLLVGAVSMVLGLLWLAGRWLVQQRVVRGAHCPNCGQTGWHRRHRHLAEYVFGLGMKARRYRCTNPDCHWEGLRQTNSA
jgi:hypothetical protein